MTQSPKSQKTDAPVHSERKLTLGETLHLRETPVKRHQARAADDRPFWIAMRNDCFRPSLCKNAEVAYAKKFPTLKHRVSSGQQHEAIHRRGGPDPGELAPRVS